MTIQIKNVVYVLLLILLGILIYFPSLDVLPYISEGDTGRDLYVFERTMQGGIPYQDYYWPYGPVMPYYYALFFKIFGVSIPSVLLGRVILNILSGIIVFAALRLYFRPGYSLLGAVWFWSFLPEFTYTFNHNGGVFCILLIIYSLMRRAIDPRWPVQFILGPALFVLILIKLNTGLAVAAATTICYLKIETHHGRSFKRPLVELLGFTGLSIIGALLLYILILWSVPPYFLFQCVPILPGYETFGGSLGKALGTIGRIVGEGITGKPSLNQVSMFFSPWPFQLMAFLGSYAVISLFIKQSEKQGLRSAAKVGMISILIFILFLTHEFWASATDYRLWWCSSLMILAFLMSLGFLLEGKSMPLRVVFLAILTITAGLEFDGKYRFRDWIMTKPEQYLPMERARIYVNNPAEYVRTISLGTRWIQEHVGRQETLLAIPYNPIYNFLTERASPIPEMAFYDRLNVAPEQEERIVADLEQANTKWILISNRAFSKEPGLGVFGETYCPRLHQFWQENYELVETIGDWEGPAGWIAFNANKIYRKSPR